MNTTHKIMLLAIFVLSVHVGMQGYFNSLWNGITGKCQGCTHE